MATFTLYLPDDITAQVESRRHPLSRSGYIRRVVEEALGQPVSPLRPGPEVLTRTLGPSEATPTPKATRSPKPITGNPDLVNISMTDEGTLVKTAERSPTGHRENCKCLNCERARGKVS